MKKYLTYYLSFASLSTLFAQQQQPNPYFFQHDIVQQIEQDTTAWKWQTAAATYARSGHYFDALNSFDIATNARIYSPTTADSTFYRSLTPVDARDYILKRAKNEEIVIINEAHHNPKHRLFTKSLLRELYQNGFRYLGLEALDDTQINTRKFPNQTSGFYTNEPEFGNLIHEAIQLGFTVFGYEATEFANAKEREIAQAKNILAFLGTQPKGKVLIHCGFDHAYEGEVRGWEKAMAGRLHEFSGINPFTINQSSFSEKGAAEKSHYLSRANSTTAPFVLIDSENQPIGGLRKPYATDCIVVHPITPKQDKTPIWQQQNRKAQIIPIPKSTSNEEHVQILVYRTGEMEKDGIPTAIAYATSKATSAEVFLPEGEYDVQICNQKYVVIEKRKLLVKE